MGSTRKNLTNECSEAYFRMYELLLKLNVIEYRDGDSLEDLFCSMELFR